MVSIMKALPADRPLHRRYLHVATTSDPVGWGAREVASNETKGTPPPAAEVNQVDSKVLNLRSGPQAARRLCGPDCRGNNGKDKDASSKKVCGPDR